MTRLRHPKPAAHMYDLLVRAMRMPLPMPLAAAEVELARNYVAAGLVDARLPPAGIQENAVSQPIVPMILGITARGRAAVVDVTKRGSGRKYR